MSERHNHLMITKKMIERARNELYRDITEKPATLPEYIQMVADNLGGMLICFQPGRIDGFTLRGMATGLYYMIEADSVFKASDWGQRLESYALSILAELPENGWDQSELVEQLVIEAVPFAGALQAEPAPSGAVPAASAFASGSSRVDDYGEDMPPARRYPGDPPMIFQRPAVAEPVLENQAVARFADEPVDENVDGSTAVVGDGTTSPEAEFPADPEAFQDGPMYNTVLGEPEEAPALEGPSVSIFELPELSVMVAQRVNIPAMYEATSPLVDLSLPEDLRPTSGFVPGSVAPVSMPAPMIVPRIPNLPAADEKRGMQERLIALRDTPFYQASPYPQYISMVNSCLNDMDACFGGNGEITDATQFAALVKALGQMAMYLEHFISTPLGVDVYETSMRLAHLIDPARASILNGGERALLTQKQAIDEQLAVISNLSSSGKTLPYCTPFVVDWLAKMSMCYGGPAIDQVDVNTLRDLAVGLTLLVMENFSFLIDGIDEQIVQICGEITSRVTKSFWGSR